jgi:hypothetical protein
MKNLLTTLVLTIALTSTGFAADATFKGSASAQNTITITNVASALDLNSDINDVTVFNYAIRNNDPNGFKLSFTSANSGQMRKSTGYDVNSTGTFVDYTVSVVRGNTGTLGATETSLPSDQALSAQTSLDLHYNQSVKQGTRNADYNLSIKTSDISQKDLLSGEFSDTITVVIANL